MAENYEGWLLTTVAGNGAEGYAGDGGSAVEATLNNPFDVVFDSQGRLIFTDTFGQRIKTDRRSPQQAKGDRQADRQAGVR